MIDHRDNSLIPLDRQVRQYYERVMWAFRCVDAIATKVAGPIPLGKTIDDPDDGLITAAMVEDTLSVRSGRWVRVDVAELFEGPKKHQPHRWPLGLADTKCLLKGCPT
jgi:hypothetical protein